MNWIIAKRFSNILDNDENLLCKKIEAMFPSRIKMIMETLFLPDIWKQIYSFLEENRDVYRKRKHLVKSKNLDVPHWFELCSNIVNKKHLSYRHFVKKYTRCYQRTARSTKEFIVNRKAIDVFPNLYAEFITKLVIVESIRHRHFDGWIYNQKYAVFATF